MAKMILKVKVNDLRFQYQVQVQVQILYWISYRQEYMDC